MHINLLFKDKGKTMICRGFCLAIISFCTWFLSFASGAELPDTFLLNRAQNKQGEYKYKEGEDFQTWRHKTRSALIEKLGISKKLSATRVPLEPRILWSREVENGMIFKISLKSEADYDLPIYLCVPKGEGPFPVWICLQGHGTGMHASISVQWQDETTFKSDNGDRDFAIQCLAKGYAALCVEQRALGEKSCMDDRKYGCRRLALHNLMFGETLIGNRVFDVDRAIDFIYTKECLRNDRIGIIGNSGGGTTAIYSGAILDRLTHVMPSSCFSTYKDSILAKNHCPCNYFPDMLNWGDMGDLAGLCAPKYLVIVNGVQDTIFPIEPAKAEFERCKVIYKAAGYPERCRMVIGSAGHRFYKEDAWPVMDPFLNKTK